MRFCIVHRGFTRTYKGVPAGFGIRSIVFCFIVLSRKCLDRLQVDLRVGNILLKYELYIFECVRIVVCLILIGCDILRSCPVWILGTDLTLIKQRCQIIFRFLECLAIGGCARCCCSLQIFF